jgi:hypothetical protein
MQTQNGGIRGKDVNISWTPEAVESFVQANNILYRDLL